MAGNGALLNIFDDAPFRRGPLNDEERHAAVTICDRATSKAEAIDLLAMLGLLRKEATP